MKRLKDEFLNLVETKVPLQGKRILEVGCGSGSRSIAIAERCSQLDAIEPDAEMVKVAKEKNARESIQYHVGSAEALTFQDQQFDATIFTLSLHHVSFDNMKTAISEAVRVTKKGGHVIFLESAHEGSYFEAEILFDAGDGDERKEKARAYSELLGFEGYTEVAEIDDETVFQFDSEEDFAAVFHPQKNLDQIGTFLRGHDHVLNAKRRINIFAV